MKVTYDNMFYLVGCVREAMDDAMRESILSYLHEDGIDSLKDLTEDELYQAVMRFEEMDIKESGGKFIDKQMLTIIRLFIDLINDKIDGEEPDV